LLTRNALDAEQIGDSADAHQALRTSGKGGQRQPLVAALVATSEVRRRSAGQRLKNGSGSNHFQSEEYGT
jgi:hypothetical protein